MEKKIIQLFLTNKKLKFNEIEKLLKVRSNKIDYHLKKLVSKNILEKDKSSYSLSESSEYLIPYISEKNPVLPVVLILLGNKKESFMYKRTKRPYENFLSLPGGRILLGERINDSVKRIMKEKHGINASFKKINSISLEHIKKNKKIVHSFILFFVTAETKQKFDLYNIIKNKHEIIPSDYKLITNDSEKKTEIRTIISKTK